VGVTQKVWSFNARLDMGIWYPVPVAQGKECV
jgi:hypothetical protein